MLSRVANSIYWINKYIERAENYARFIDVNHRLTMDLPPGLEEQWLSLTASLNSLNRSMGMKDVYPFVWSGPVLEKLGFIQQIINRFKQGVYQ